MNKIAIRMLLVPCALLCCLAPAIAEISFSNPDINAKGAALFTVTADVPGNGRYDTLFLKDIPGERLEQLTFYPEAMDALLGGSVLQVRNRFGTGRYDTRNGSFRWIDDYKPFYTGGTAGFGNLPLVAPSPDGRWQVSVEPISSARGRLMLYDAEKSLRYIIAESVERGSLPVSWSPDSTVFV